MLPTAAAHANASLLAAAWLQQQQQPQQAQVLWTARQPTAFQQTPWPRSAIYDQRSPEGPLIDNTSLTAATSSGSCPLPAPCPPVTASAFYSAAALPHAQPTAPAPAASAPSSLLPFLPNAELLACAAALPSARSLRPSDSCPLPSRTASGTHAAADSRRRCGGSLDAAAWPKRQRRSFEEAAARVAAQQRLFLRVNEQQQRQQQQRLQYQQQVRQQLRHQQQQQQQQQQQDDTAYMKDLFEEDAEWAALVDQAVQPLPPLQQLPPTVLLQQQQQKPEQLRVNPGSPSWAGPWPLQAP